MAIISIIIPSYNRCGVIRKALDSIQSQSFCDWDCFVVDDHSTDGTKDLILDYCKKDSRFFYLVNSRTKGAQGARNTGLFASSSEWIFFLDSDDDVHEDFLSTLFSEAPVGCDVIKFFSDIIDKDSGKIVGKHEWICNGDIHDSLINGRLYVDFNQIAIRRDKLIAIGGLDEQCPSMQEFDTNLRLSTVSKYHTIEKPLVNYYVGGSDTISINSKKQVLGKLYLLKKYKAEWLKDKRNADRMIYELYQQLRPTNSVRFKSKVILALICSFPEMVWYYSRKKLQEVFQVSSNIVE